MEDTSVEAKGMVRHRALDCTYGTAMKIGKASDVCIQSFSPSRSSLNTAKPINLILEPGAVPCSLNGDHSSSISIDRSGTRI